MNVFTAMLTTIALLTSTPTQAQTLDITRGGSRPVRQAPAENFTGGVRVEMLFEAVDNDARTAISMSCRTLEDAD